MEFPEHGSPIILCAEHGPQYEMKLVRAPNYGPKRKGLIVLSDQEVDNLNASVLPAVSKFLDATAREGGKASTEVGQ